MNSKTIVPLVALLTIAACAPVRYVAPGVSETNGIVIKTAADIGFTSVDGEDVRDFAREVLGGRDKGLAREVVIAPGLHIFTVRYSRSISYGVGTTYYWTDHTIQFEAKAGHTYEVQGAPYGNEQFVWVRDLNDQAIVYGREPQFEDYLRQGTM